MDLGKVKMAGGRHDRRRGRGNCRGDVIYETKIKKNISRMFFLGCGNHLYLRQSRIYSESPGTLDVIGLASQWRDDNSPESEAAFNNKGKMAFNNPMTMCAWVK